MVRKDVSVLDRPYAPSAIAIAVQSLETAAIAVVPYLQNDSAAHRRGRVAVYGQDVVRMKGIGQFQVAIHRKSGPVPMMRIVMRHI